jgi:hypothetical protein
MTYIEREQHERMRRSIRRRLDKSQRREVAEHGADAGWPGFIYTTECCRFYQRHKEAIWTCLSEDAQEYGCSVPELIAQFRRKDMAEDVHQFENLLAWYALEKVCQEEEVQGWACREADR